MAQELGNGWVAALDPGSGRTYYANTVTVSGGGGGRRGPHNRHLRACCAAA